MYFSQRFRRYNHVQLQHTISSSFRWKYSPSFKQYSCARFWKDFEFLFRYGVPLFSLYEVDICRNLLLLENLMLTKLELFLSYTCLSGFRIKILMKWNTLLMSSRCVSRSNGGNEDLCIKIGYRQPIRAESRERYSGVAKSSRVTLNLILIGWST